MIGDILILFAALFVPFLYAASQYECGAHGRFEYCIDGIPGCVVGCHCHPGYYFDTDTKICEPNIKLSQDFRRQYPSEPSRVHVAPITSPPQDTSQPVTLNAVDEKIDEIAKDADDLGDWLYNQFFKTIENQVINKTQGEELPLTKSPTRRSGDVLLNKPSRRSHKYWKGRKKKKSKGLKSKLLRITEDDSLFDSDSGSSHEDDSASSSESDTSRSDDKDIKRNKKSDDHGHKKIIIFNKKPQPPLPSFIFLPNMETPYYPPIGLPPPPAMPMYPMVPVPPMLPGPQMGGPLFPYPGVPPRCDEDEVTPSARTSASISASTSSSTSTTFSSTTTSMTSPVTVLTDPTNPTASTDTTITSTTTKTEESLNNGLRHRNKKRNKSIGRSNNERGFPLNPLLYGDRNNKILKKLREKLNRKNKLENYYVDQYQELGDPMNGNDPLELVPSRDGFRPNMYQMTPVPDVDFKYLAELIHKGDLNKNLNSRPSLTKQNNKYAESLPAAPEPSRRSYYPMNNINDRPANYVMRQRSRMDNHNDLFYTNLGKQIASMIRKIDSKEEREVNIEIEGANSKQLRQTSPVFNENNYASRSYWERSVRSPLKYLGSFKKEMDHLKKSNEDLFSLETKVEKAAIASPSLSLHDLENIISTVEKVQLKKPKRNNINSEKTDNSNLGFKLNLLPGNVRTMQPVQVPKPVQSFKSKDSDIIQQVNTRRKQPYASFLLSNFRQLSPDYDDSVRITGSRKDLIQSMKPTRKQSVKNKRIEIAAPTHLNTKNISPLRIATANKTNFKYQQTPVMLNHRTLNYHTHNQNPYQFGKVLQIQNSGSAKSLVPFKQLDKPSYFHHEFHHFDFFDK